MSHITTVEMELKDLEAVKALCKEKGWTFKEGQKTYAWYGRFVGDSPIPNGMTVEDYGKCDHAVGFPGASYEVGLRATPDGRGYKLAFDSFVSGGLTPHIGETGGRFMQGYGICKAEREAKRRGLNVRRVQSGNKVKLVMTGNGL